MKLLSHPSMSRHVPGPDHPESPERLHAILDELRDLPVELCERRATRDELCTVHAAAYVDHVLSLVHGGALDEETLLSEGSVDAAMHAAGVALAAVDSLSRTFDTAFALVRPPGHHARADAGMGYCIFNNIALAVHRALASGTARVAIVDWDAHHGNGTQDILGDRGNVLIVDFHQDGLFPVGTGGADERGRGDGEGHTINVPLQEGDGDQAIIAAMDRIALPALERFAPEFIIVAAGFDAHWTDPQANLTVSADGFAALTERVAVLARRLDAPLLLVLEGGYDPVPLARNVRRCIDTIVAAEEERSDG